MYHGGEGDQGGTGVHGRGTRGAISEASVDRNRGMSVKVLRLLRSSKFDETSITYFLL